jgi:hypothetical protein
VSGAEKLIDIAGTIPAALNDIALQIGPWIRAISGF